MTLVTVYRTFNPTDAHVVRSRLEVAELHPAVVHETATLSMEGYSMSTGGVLVQVPDHEEAAARELLAAKDEPQA